MSNPTLPDDVYETLVEVCNRHPGPVQDDRLFGEILNEVAWRHRFAGFGLSRKTGGRHVPSPVGDIAEDVLQRRSDGHHWDVLGGAAVSQPLRPTRGQSIGVMRDPNRPWVAPVEPAGSSVPDTPVPPVKPTAPPVNPLPPDADLVDAGTKLQAYYQQKLGRADVDILGWARWLGFDYIYTRGRGASHEAALDAMFRNIEAITGIPR